MNKEFLVTIKYFINESNTVIRNFNFDDEAYMNKWVRDLMEDYEKKKVKYEIIVERKETILTLLLDYKSN